MINTIKRMTLIALATIMSTQITAGAHANLSKIPLRELKQREQQLIKEREEKRLQHEAETYNQYSTIRKAAITAVPIATFLTLAGASLYIDIFIPNNAQPNYPFSLGGLPLAFLCGAGTHEALMPTPTDTPEIDAINNELNAIQHELNNRNDFYLEAQKSMLDELYCNKQ